VLEQDRFYEHERHRNGIVTSLLPDLWLPATTRRGPRIVIERITQWYNMGVVRKTLTAIRLKPEQIKNLQKIAVREDVSVSWLIRRAIDEFLKHRK
jgi:Ribbon-helix-helix protein, copG family